MPAHQRFDHGDRRRALHGARLACGALALVALAAGTHADEQIASVNGTVRALVVWGDDLIAAGDFTMAGDTPVRHIARWDGTKWNPIGDGMAPDGTNAPVRALAAYEDELYVGGEFDEAGGVSANHVAKWNGQQWSPLGSGTNGPVNALVSRFGVQLYAGGSFSLAGGVEVNNVAEWYFGAWSPMGDGLDGIVEDLTWQRDSRVVAAGDFLIAGGTLAERQIAGFTGGEWVAENVAFTAGLAHAVLYGPAGLVMGGQFSVVWWDTKGYSVARKVGPLWQALSLGVGLDDVIEPGEVRVLANFAGGVAAGGLFKLAGGLPASNVAFHDGSVWTALGAGVDGDVLALTEYRDHLVVGGSFATAGGLPFANIAAWNGVRWSQHVPVLLDDLRVQASAQGVHLSWRLPRTTLEAVSKIAVERATEASGPFTVLSDDLLPASYMQWHDVSVQPQRVYWYRLRFAALDGQLSHVGPLRIETRGPGAPVDLLSSFDPGSGQPIQIRYRLGQAANVRLEIFDTRGRAIRLLESGLHAPGEYVRVWDRSDREGRPAARGVYFVQLEAGDTRHARRLILLTR